jgi:hypothetical protein
MLPHRLASFILALLVFCQPARGAESSIITLSCDGTVKDASTTPISNPIPIDRTPKPVTIPRRLLFSCASCILSAYPRKFDTR